MTSGRSVADALLKEARELFAELEASLLLAEAEAWLERATVQRS